MAGLVCASLLGFGLFAEAQTLNIPPRPEGAPTGTQFTNVIATLLPTERENWIYAQVISGNVPDWFRTLKPVSMSASGHTGTFYAAPDYLAIGSDQDYFLMPCTPMVAQRLATRLGCSLPTRRMVNQIWTNAAVKLTPGPFSPETYDILSLEVFGLSNAAIRSQRDAQTNSQPLGALVSGDKKDVIVSNEITNRPPPPRVVLYGWHYPDGSFIQPLSAVHEETYADYSHGARLVQMNMTVDGGANTVTNVLASAALNPLLSDEGTILQARYNVAPLAPVLMTHPRSTTEASGTNVTLRTLAIGDPPPAYRWQFNGANIAAATNSTFSITNVATTDAGQYVAIVTNSAGAATSRVAVVRVKTSAFPLLFSDDFDTNTATNWDVFWGATNGVPDFAVDWAFDYGVIPYTFNGVTALIPPAPNSPAGSTRAARLAVNINDAAPVIAAVNIYPRSLSVTGNFAFKFDLWINYPGDAGGTGSGVTGSTQHGIFGINHLGTIVNWAAPSATASDGLWFAASGEGGDSRDYRAYRGDPAGTQMELTTPATSGLAGSNHTATFFQNLFPASRFETAGAPGKNWVEVELRQTNNVIVWLMDGVVVALRTNTSSFTGGKIMLGLMDTFNSIASPARDAFVLFDNVRIENLAPPIGFRSVTRLAGQDVSLVLTSALGDSFWLEASTNLNAWQPLSPLVMTNNPLTFTDSNAPGPATRFYRARR